MLSYGGFFALVDFCILVPIISLLLVAFSYTVEQETHLLEIENHRMYLENELHKSEYGQLTQQIQPHFLFNTLNSMLSLARLKRFDQLVQSFEHLALFLRYKYLDKQQLCPLKQELDHTRHYLAIQRMRFGARIQVHWAIDSSLEEALIPPYLIQTLVENAFKHGLEQVEEGVLSIRLTKRTNDQREFNELTIVDSGPGFSADPLNDLGTPQGIGLINLARRLQLLFSSEARLEFRLSTETERGGLVKVTWPLIFTQGGDEIERSLA